jgi:hypothetical protein
MSARERLRSKVWMWVDEGEGVEEEEQDMWWRM